MRNSPMSSSAVSGADSVRADALQGANQASIISASVPWTQLMKLCGSALSGNVRNHGFLIGGDPSQDFRIAQPPVE